MKRFGTTHISSQAMDDTHIFLMRLHLLILMVKAKLKGYPGGGYRREAVLGNSACIFKAIPKLNIFLPSSNTASHLFKERVKLLSVMATAIICEEYPLGIHRREAVIDNIEIIIQTVFPRQKISLFHDILMAA
jgi:hypothetical protein